MAKPTYSVFLLFFALNFSLISALYDHICNTKPFYEPYVHIYQGRKGPRILERGPGFNHTKEYENIYVCVNGPAYMYFSRNTDLGEVFETPQPKDYVHYCEMFNVKPRDTATYEDIQLKLWGILLLGEKTDYRNPSIEMFKAPYYFSAEQLNALFQNNETAIDGLYMNAVSLVLIGQQECNLRKGKDLTSLIKVRPSEYPIPDPPTDPKEKVTEIGHICRMGYQTRLDELKKEIPTPPAVLTPAEEEKRQTVLALLHNEEIRLLDDDPTESRACPGIETFNVEQNTLRFENLEARFRMIEENYKKEDLLRRYDTGNQDRLTVVSNLTTKKNELDTWMTEWGTNDTVDAKTKTRKEKELNETNELLALEQANLDRCTAEADLIEGGVNNIKDNLLEKAKPNGTEFGGPANSSKIDLESGKTNWTETKKNETLVYFELDAEKSKYEVQKNRAQVAIRAYRWALSDLEVAVIELNKTVERAKPFLEWKQASIDHKKHHKNKLKKGKININTTGLTPSIVVKALEGDPATNRKPECGDLPRIYGEQGECKKGKPSAEKACGIFDATLAAAKTKHREPNAPAPPWKEVVLNLIGDIFAKACARIPNAKKMARLVNAVMGYYLNDTNTFNKQPNISHPDTHCLNYKTAKQLKIFGLAGVGGEPRDGYTEKKPFWDTIITALEGCKKRARRMRVVEVETPGTHGDQDKDKRQFLLLKKNRTGQEMVFNVTRHHEQADDEFSYNFPLDLNWKMFVTVMGYCMPSYEKRIPLITSRFFSLYTEYFLIPLRETWIRPDDNVIFQFILGEFYNEDTEVWADVCMESSFLESGLRDYRPPRSILVNCASEHNYFVNGHFPKFPPKHKKDTITDTTADAKNDTITDTNVDAKNDTITDTNADAKNDNITDTNADAKSDTNTDTKTDTKIDSTTETKMDIETTPRSTS